MAESAASRDGALLSQPVVIDNGTGVIKAGMAGGDRPTAVFASAVGRAKHVRMMPGGALEGSDVFVGVRARAHRGALRLSQPMARGMVEDWADMERVWAHVYSDDGLGRPSDAHPLLLTEAPLNAARHRELAAEMLFEHFNVPALYLAPQAILSLYASGRTTGLVLDVGDGVAHAVPVYEGFAVPHAVTRMDVAGRDVGDRLTLLLRRADCVLSTSAERDIAREIKERRCYVALDPAKDEHAFAALGAAAGNRRGADAPNSSAPQAMLHTLPDGSTVELGAERFRAPEVLFDPQLVGSEAGGVHTVVALAALKADLDLRATLYSQIVLAGGSTLFPGFGERLLKELRSKLPPHAKIRIHAPPERQLSTWVGGSILASLPSFRTMWVSRADFEEHGARIFSARAL
ncbi:actin-like protein [Pelagophyceae sp. CCMP2097]|nr:actin-like protein [Pelagophyceae sp. CCMP2097]|mmetsp:Transcript_0/g.1  ORF Transcript_0/g.1 Transcript_0/m.1 type:complete len:404 (+) Transcript_0:59-1270(+)